MAQSLLDGLTEDLSQFKSKISAEISPLLRFLFFTGYSCVWGSPYEAFLWLSLLWGQLLWRLKEMLRVSLKDESLHDTTSDTRSVCRSCNKSRLLICKEKSPPADATHRHMHLDMRKSSPPQWIQNGGTWLHGDTRHTVLHGSIPSGGSWVLSRKHCQKSEMEDKDEEDEWDLGGKDGQQERREGWWLKKREGGVTGQSLSFRQRKTTTKHDRKRREGTSTDECLMFNMCLVCVFLYSCVYCLK